MIFPVLELESVVQVNDKTRLSALKSYKTPDEDDISKIEIKPDSESDFITVTDTSFLDWQYATEGEKTVTVKITLGEGDNEKIAQASKIIKVLTAEQDYLYSDDSMLTSREPDILKWVSEGRSSFLNVHREAQIQILSWLDERGYTTCDGNKITKELFVDKTEVRDWSKFLTLKLIFEGIHNSVDDVFMQKADGYAADMESARNRAFLRYKFGTDSESNDIATTAFNSIRLERR